MFQYEKLPYMLHGGDYNPEQWKDWREMIDQDIGLMKMAGINCATVGVFAWANIEKGEGNYDFSWLDYLVEQFERNDMKIIMATPSAAVPVWMGKKYPEVLRVKDNRVRSQWGERSNYCPSSPVYRQKCREIDGLLAARYGSSPALVMWHVNNEISGGCFCPNCEARFREWLQKKYKTLENLNEQWWNGFWGHSFREWDEAGFPGYVNGKLDETCTGQQLDMKRFFSYIMAEHYIDEYHSIREYSETVPVTTNTWRVFGDMNFREFEPYMDVMAFDFYPQYNDQPGDCKFASAYGFALDYYRGMKAGAPFVIMETAPGVPLMQATKIRRPGIQKLITAQALSCGANSIHYFQWRKGRGGTEQYHGAVMDHCNRTDTKTFRDIQEVSQLLKSVAGVKDKKKQSCVAVIYDMESDWAIGAVHGTHPQKKLYKAECVSHYRAFYEMGMNVDVVDMETELSKYKLVIAPMLYLMDEKRAEKIKDYVAEGGCFVTTFYTGWVNENTLAHTGGFPGLLRDVTGIWVEDMDSLNDGEHVLEAWVENVPQMRKKGRVDFIMSENDLNLSGRYVAHTFCDQIHLEGAEAVAFYDGEFYKGNPCITKNHYGRGQVYYLGVRTDDDFRNDFYKALAASLGVEPVIKERIPEGIVATERGGYIFLMNFTDQEKELVLCDIYICCQTGRQLKEHITLPAYGTIVMQRKE